MYTGRRAELAKNNNVAKFPHKSGAHYLTGAYLRWGGVGVGVWGWGDGG